MMSSPTRCASTCPARDEQVDRLFERGVRIPAAREPSPSASEGLKRAPATAQRAREALARVDEVRCGAAPRLSWARSAVATSEPGVTAVTALISFITR